MLTDIKTCKFAFNTNCIQEIDNYHYCYWQHIHEKLFNGISTCGWTGNQTSL